MVKKWVNEERRGKSYRTVVSEVFTTSEFLEKISNLYVIGKIVTSTISLLYFLSGCLLPRAMVFPCPLRVALVPLVIRTIISAAGCQRNEGKTQIDCRTT